MPLPVPDPYVEGGRQYQESNARRKYPEHRPVNIHGHGRHGMFVSLD